MAQKWGLWVSKNLDPKISCLCTPSLYQITKKNQFQQKNRSETFFWTQHTALKCKTPLAKNKVIKSLGQISC